MGAGRKMGASHLRARARRHKLRSAFSIASLPEAPRKKMGMFMGTKTSSRELVGAVVFRPGIPCATFGKEPHGPEHAGQSPPLA